MIWIGKRHLVAKTSWDIWGFLFVLSAENIEGLQQGFSSAVPLGPTLSLALFYDPDFDIFCLISSYFYFCPP